MSLYSGVIIVTTLLIQIKLFVTQLLLQHLISSFDYLIFNFVDGTLVVKGHNCWLTYGSESAIYLELLISACFQVPVTPLTLKANLLLVRKYKQF